MLSRQTRHINVEVFWVVTSCGTTLHGVTTKKTST